ncbi:hypothetical protein CTAYLR_001262 [Chrysophaeum taylorii]|uniref:Uncharacterized protein n=1 Tax=Chrysophaeum taylorii TaxID=2483200 RepID=A0AAD7UED7_9STRA|nr:hypothetical protein CTAYLR_001262 [Chrysophaeum taylorii]
MLALLILPGALGFQQAVAPRATVAAKETKADLEALAKGLNPIVGFWDPLGCAEYDFWGLGNEATIGFLRHAEIKHGRIAMAGFLGFCAQCTPLVAGPHKVLPYTGYVPGVTPQEQWDNIPYIGKLQIITFIGMLESYGEGAGNPEGYVHYTCGGKPGYFPPIKGKGLGQIPLDLYDPLGWFPKNKTPEELEKGLKAEINNGRLAMIGLLGLLSESSTPGSVPVLSGISSFPKYSGEVMAPFSADWSFSTIPAYTYFH